MNILIIAHIFSSLLLSPLSMPSLSISNAVSPGFLSSESRIKRRRSLQFSIENSSKDVRWNTEEPITQEIQASSMLRENSVQRWSVKYWTFFAAVQWRRWFLSRHCWCWKVDKIVLKTMFLFFCAKMWLQGNPKNGPHVVFNYRELHSWKWLEKVLIPRSYYRKIFWHYLRAHSNMFTLRNINYLCNAMYKSCSDIHFGFSSFKSNL